MTERLDFKQAFPEGHQAMLGLERAVHEAKLEPELLELVKIRASQINGCAHCLDMHTKDARAIGMSEQRIYLLSAWREAPFYTARERAALVWTECLTRLPAYGAPDDVYDDVAAAFAEGELAVLTLAIVAINGWNRLAVGFKSDVGTYKSPRRPAAGTES